MKQIKENGFSFAINPDNTAKAQLNEDFKGGDVVVPTEINGVSVTKFYFFPSDTGGEVKIDSVKLHAGVEVLLFDEFLYNGVRIEIDENNPFFFTDGKAVYTKEDNELIGFFARDDEEYTILPGCTAIRKNAFSHSRKIKRVIFPEGLASIEDSAFRDCAVLTEIELPEGLHTLGQCAFYNCHKLEKVTLPSTLSTIERFALDWTDNDLTVRLPKELEIIGERAFPYGWTLEVSRDNPFLISRGGLIMSRNGKTVICPAKPVENGTLVIPEGVEEIDSYAFEYYMDIEKVIFPKSLRTIGYKAFSNAQCIRELVIEDGREIKEFAFEYCTSMKKISIKCVVIGRMAFYRCYSLTEAEIDSEITGKQMFDSCERLQRVVLKNTIMINNATFLGLHELKEVIMPPELEMIADGAFSDSGIKTLTIPKSVKVIGNYIASCISEIHIYDNIKTDLGLNHVLSRTGFTLYVHSAQTDEIIYAVPVIGMSYNTRQNNEHTTIIGMFNGGVSFDFKKFDRYYDIISDEHYPEEKFRIGTIRLKYPYELDDEMRRRYEEKLNVLALPVATKRIEDNDIEELLDPGFYKYVTIENILPLVDLSVEKGMTELTAVLMQMCNTKRAGINN